MLAKQLAYVLIKYFIVGILCVAVLNVVVLSAFRLPRRIAAPSF